MMGDLGAEVTILEALPQILPGVDKDVVNVVLRSFKGRSIDVRTGVQGARATRRSRKAARPIELGDGEKLEVDAVVVSVGRRALSDNLGLDGTGVKVDERGFVVVDEYCAPAPTACTRSATWSPRRTSPTSGSPRRSSRSRSCSASRRCRSTTARSRGASTAIPRSRSAATPRRRPRTRATTSSRRCTAGPATAGR